MNKKLVNGIFVFLLVFSIFGFVSAEFVDTGNFHACDFSGGTSLAEGLLRTHRNCASYSFNSGDNTYLHGAFFHILTFYGIGYNSNRDTIHTPEFTIKISKYGEEKVLVTRKITEYEFNKINKLYGELIEIVSSDDKILGSRYGAGEPIFFSFEPYNLEKDTSYTLKIETSDGFFSFGNYKLFNKVWVGDSTSDKPSTTTMTYTCTDTDKETYGRDEIDRGLDPYTKGSVTFKTSLGDSVTYKDSCIDDSTLKEYLCYVRKYPFIYPPSSYSCKKCVDGRCIKRIYYYRLENNECSKTLMYETEKTQNDYETLEECESKLNKPTEPTTPSPSGIWELIQKFLNWLKNLFGIQTFSIIGDINVEPNTEHTYQIDLSAPLPDSDWSDGTISWQWGRWVLVDKNGNLKQEGEIELINGEYKKSVTITTPASTGNYAIVGIITQKDAIYNFNTKQWTYEEEVILNKEAINIKNENVIEEPEVPIPNSFQKLIQAIRNWFCSKIGWFC